MPQKIEDKTFTTFSDSKIYEIQNKIQLFILAHLKTSANIVKTLENLINFKNNFLKCPETKFSFFNKRRQFRQDVKKYFRPKNQSLVIFFDIEIYLEDQWENFNLTIDKFIENLEKYKTSINN